MSDLRSPEQTAKEFDAMCMDIKLKLNIARAERAEAKCAEMREALQKVSKWLVGNTDTVEENPLLDDVVLHALSYNCGKGFIPVKELELTIKFLRLALEPVFPGTWLDEEGHRELARLESLVKETK